MQSSESLGTPTVRQFITPSAIVVEPSLTTSLSILALLVASEFHVTLADTYFEGRQRLTHRPPELLITELALGEYNGLGLVLYGKALRPDLAAVVTCTLNDPVLRADAEAVGATFVLKPVSQAELRAAVVRTLYRKADGSAPPIRPPFERRSYQRRLTMLPPPDERRLVERRGRSPELLRRWAVPPQPESE